MSYYDKPKPLGQVLNGLIDRLGMREKIEAARAVEEWAHLAGPQINGVTSSVWMERGTLFVKITSAPWRHELHLRRAQWRDELNTRLGKPLVQEIVFR